MRESFFLSSELSMDRRSLRCVTIDSLLSIKHFHEAEEDEDEMGFNRKFFVAERISDKS